MVVDWQHIAELAFMGIVSFAGTFGGIRARLTNVEKEAERAHERIDTIYSNINAR